MQSLFRNSQLSQELEKKWHRLYRLAYSWCHDPHLSKDLAQEAVTKALKNNHQLRDKKMLDSWLFKILVNCWRDYCRKQKDVSSLEYTQLVDHVSPDVIHNRDHIVHNVRNAVKGLKHEYREVVTLVDLEQMNYKEVAEILDIPIGTVMSRLCRARIQLKNILLDYSEKAEPSVVRRIK